MSIELITEIRPKNGAQFAILDDQFIRGGFHTAATLSERNSLPQDLRKVGMKIYVQSTDQVFTLGSDLVSWTADMGATQSLQQAYNGGYEIITTPLNPVTLHGADNSSTILKIESLVNNVAEFRGDGSVEVMNSFMAKEYTSSLQFTIAANSPNMQVDVTENLYRAVQYFYTISNSDNSGFETGQLYLVQNGTQAPLCAIIGSTVGIPCGISFSTSFIGSSMVLRASSDNSGSFSRVINLLKIALI